MTTQAPPPIRQLDERVVNKIAAGEVVQRPASALKELLENSLDAGATQVSVTVKDGGIKMLQIQDNGHGIRKDDLPILAHRHTTSKLKEFEDLETIGTLGFRGEALCSISFVSHLTITTMTAGQPHGYRAVFKDSELLDPPGIRPVAAVQGTLIVAEDMFYNIPMRQKALKSASEEYARVLDVVSRYAVFKTGVALSCKRQGEARSDLNTLATASRLDNIRAVYGPAVSKELVPLTIKVGKAVTPDILPTDEEVSFTADVLMSGSGYSSKRSMLVLFINERPVECAPLRRALEAVYAAVLPQTSKPWVFMDLRLPPRHVEVNMHPTKREVGFLNQDAIIDAIRQAVEQKLQSSAHTRTFKQAQLTFLSAGGLGSGAAADGSSAGGGDAGPAAVAAPYRPAKLVRTDPRSQQLDVFFDAAALKTAAVAGSVSRKRSAAGRAEGLVDISNTLEEDTVMTTLTADGRRIAAAAAAGMAEAERSGRDSDEDDGEEDDVLVASTSQAADVGVGRTGGTQKRGRRRAVRQRPNPSTPYDLASVRGLLAEVDAACHTSLADLLGNHTFVGMADDELALVQYGTRLYLVDIVRMARDLFYQQALRRFGRCGRVELQPPVPLLQLSRLGMEVQAACGAWQPEHGSQEELSQLMSRLLSLKAEMLLEYFSIGIDGEGMLYCLPLLIEGYAPDMSRLPDFVLRLARDVDWDDEERCFKTLAQVLGDFYAEPPDSTLSDERSVDAPAAQREASNGIDGLTAGNAVPPTDDSLAPRSCQQKASPATAANDGLSGVFPPASLLVPPASPMVPSADCQLNDGSAALAADAFPAAAVAAAASGVTPADPLTLARDAEVAGAPAAAPAIAPAAAGPATETWAWRVKHVLFPAMKLHLKPPRLRGTDGSCIQIASLERLYRVFERC